MRRRFDNIQDALALLQRGEFAAAESKLRSELQAHPEDAGALTLLGVALDNLNRYQEADQAHRQAMSVAPHSPDVLNNYANHLLAGSDDEGAVKLYKQVLTQDAGHVNANVQLALWTLKQSRERQEKRAAGVEALGYLNHLPAEQQTAPAYQVVRLEALYLSGARAEADALASRLTESTRGDLRLAFSAGLAMAQAAEYPSAESFFNQALALAPADFNVLFNLGVVSASAGHVERGRELLQAALRQQPRNVDVLYQLAWVERQLDHGDEALRILAEASRIAPSRADVLKLLAVASSDLGAFEDAVNVWDRYLTLMPQDDYARRERAFTQVHSGKFTEGIAALRDFLRQHQTDAEGHYELGLAESQDNPEAGLRELNQALELRSDLAAAHAARGSIYYQMGKMDLAAADLEAAVAAEPKSANNLDRLGQAYSALERPKDAVRVLRTAAELAPSDSKIELHLARALADAGEVEASKQAMERFRQLGPEVKKAVPGGLIDYLSMTPQQRRADYSARLEKAAAEHPDDAAVEADYIKLLVEDGDAVKVASAVRRFEAMKPKGELVAGVGRALIEGRQYGAARELLEQSAPRSADADLDLAIAVFHASGAEEGLRRLEKTAEANRGGDYLLARALMSGTSGDSVELAAQPRVTRPELYREAAAAAIGAGKLDSALRLLEAAAKAFPDDRVAVVMRALTMELAGKHAEGDRLLADALGRWPEWSPAWAAQGIALATAGDLEGARTALATAVELGTEFPGVFYWLAESELARGAAGIRAAEAAVTKAQRIAPDDVWIERLKGRIASSKRGAPPAPAEAEPPYLRKMAAGTFR